MTFNIAAQNKETFEFETVATGIATRKVAISKANAIRAKLNTNVVVEEVATEGAR